MNRSGRRNRYGEEATALGDIMIRTGSLEGFPSLVFELGGDPADLLARAGIRPEELDKPDRLIPTTAFRIALNLAAEDLKCPHFGLLCLTDRGTCADQTAPRAVSRWSARACSPSSCD